MFPFVLSTFVLLMEITSQCDPPEVKCDTKRVTLSYFITYFEEKEMI